MNASITENMRISIRITKDNQFNAQNLNPLWLVVCKILASRNWVPKVDIHDILLQSSSLPAVFELSLVKTGMLRLFVFTRINDKIARPI